MQCPNVNLSAVATGANFSGSQPIRRRGKKGVDRIPQKKITPTAVSAVFSCRGSCKSSPINFKLRTKTPALSQLDTCLCQLNAFEYSSVSAPSSETSSKVDNDSSPTAPASPPPVSCMEVESCDNPQPDAPPTSSSIISSVSTMEKVPSVSHTTSESTSKSSVVSSSWVSSMKRKLPDHTTKSKVITSSKIISSSYNKTVKVNLAKPAKSETSTMISVITSSAVSSMKVGKSDHSEGSRVKTLRNILKPSSLETNMEKTNVQTSVPSVTSVSGKILDHSKSYQQSSQALGPSQSKIIKLAPSASQQHAVLESTDTPSPIPKGSTLPPLTPSGWFVVGPDGKAQLILSQKSAPKGAKVMSTPILLAPRGVVMSPPSTPVPQDEEQSLSNSLQAEIEVEATPKLEPMKNQVVIVSPGSAPKSKIVNAPRQQAVVSTPGSQASMCKVVKVSGNGVQNSHSVSVFDTTASTRKQESTPNSQPPNNPHKKLSCKSSLKTISKASPIAKLSNTKIATSSIKVPNVQELATENSEVASILSRKTQILNSASPSLSSSDVITTPALQAEVRQDAVISGPQPKNITSVIQLNANALKRKEMGASNIPGPKSEVVVKPIFQVQRNQEESASCPPLLKGQMLVSPIAKELRTYGNAPACNTTKTVVISNISIKGTGKPPAEAAAAPSAKVKEGSAEQCGVAPLQPSQLPQSQVAEIPGMTYPKGHLISTNSPEMSRNQLYILSDNKWVPLPSTSASESPVCDDTQHTEELSTSMKKCKSIKLVSKGVQTENKLTKSREVQTGRDKNIDVIERLQEEMSDLLEKYKTAQNKIMQLDTRLCTTLRSEKELHDRLEQEGHRLSFSHLSSVDGRILFYTGLKTDTFRWLLDLFTEPIPCRPGFTVTKIPKEDQLFITLVTLRLNRDNAELSDWFGVSKRTIFKVVLTWIDALHKVFFQLMKNIRSTQSSEDTLPLCFTPPPDCNMIFGCGDVVLQRTRLKPSIKTMKSLIGLAPNGLITFVADLYPHYMPDNTVVKECNLADFLIAKDLVLGDDMTGLVPDGVHTSSSEYHGDNKRAFIKSEMNIEKCIHRIREFTILNSLPLSMASSSSKVWQVCAALTNLRSNMSQKEESEVSPELAERLETLEYGEHYFDCVVIDVVDAE